MCLITFALDMHPSWPLILVANRDEFYQRASTSLHYWDDAPILAGRDQQAGGTWLGLNPAGRFAAVTNYREGGVQITDSRSRGSLVSSFLCSADDAAHFQPDPLVRTGYNLLWSDAGGFFYSSNRLPATQPLPRRLTAGVYTLSNALLDTPWPKTRHARQQLQHWLSQTTTEPDTEALLRLLTSTETAPDNELPDTGVPLPWERLLSSCFIRSAEYGTRCTTLVLQHRNGDLRMIERRYDPNGISGEQEYVLTNLPRLW